jgi:putative transposase
LVHHSDAGSQYTSFRFATHLAVSGIDASIGTVADALDNALMESFFGSLQIELLDRRAWPTRQDLTNAIFEWIEAW